MNNSNKYIPWTLLVKDFKDELNVAEKELVKRLIF